MSETLPPPTGSAGADDPGRHSHRDDLTAPLAPVPGAPASPPAAGSASSPSAPSAGGSGGRELEAPIETPWSPPGGIVAPPEATALAMAAPAGMPATAEPPVLPEAPAAPLAGPPLSGAPVAGAPADASTELIPVADASAALMTAPAAPIHQRATQEVTCPQCGTVVRIDPRARSSLDFCPNPICDYPLFWVRSAIVVTDDIAEGASHRRMPGTGGRAAAAYLPCPHCSEPNPLSAVLCVRCGGDMHPVAPPPPPPEPFTEPVFTVIEEEPEEPINWWLIILGGIAITLFVAFLVVIVLSYLI